MIRFIYHIIRGFESYGIEIHVARLLFF